MKEDDYPTSKGKDVQRPIWNVWRSRHSWYCHVAAFYTNFHHHTFPQLWNYLQVTEPSSLWELGWAELGDINFRRQKEDLRQTLVALIIPILVIPILGVSHWFLSGGKPWGCDFDYLNQAAPDYLNVVLTSSGVLVQKGWLTTQPSMAEGSRDRISSRCLVKSWEIA